MKALRLCGFLLLVLMQPLQAAGDEMRDRLKACATCHGEQGVSSQEGYSPSIAGKPAGYLYQQLLNFREGRRRHVVMQHLLAWMSDDYLHSIAAWYGAQQPAPPSAPQVLASATAELGQRLVERGDAARGIPACSACHGSQLLGVQPSIPGLLGLGHDYLRAQLGAWRSGVRAARAPDCMAWIAMQLDVTEIDAVTAWISSRPLPEPHAPAPALTAALPIDCGGVP
ncbi:MAG TPA: c-type cytochrome [Fontimonas sp.]